MTVENPEQSKKERELNPEVMDSRFTITELGPSDWKVLRDLKIKSLSQEKLAFEDVAEGREKYTRRTEQEWQDNFDKKMFLFAKDASGDYVGMVCAITENGIATVQHLYVDSDYRVLGIGKKLLQKLISKIKEDKDIHKIELQVLTTQLSAINLYHGLGFKEVKRTEKTAKRGAEEYDEIEMELITNP